MMNYLLFVDAADDAACYPVNRLLGMTCAGDGALLLKFEGSVQDTTVEEDNIDLITLTITADTEKAVMKAINQGGIVTVCDDVASEFLTSDILSCTITLDA